MNIQYAIKNGEVQLVLNTPSGRLSKDDDSHIRKAAVKYDAPYITTLVAACAAAKGIGALSKREWDVRSLQSYHAGVA